MAKLGFPYLIINSLTVTYKNFRLNFYMHDGETTMQELHDLGLKEHAK